MLTVNAMVNSIVGAESLDLFQSPYYFSLTLQLLDFF